MALKKSSQWSHGKSAFHWSLQWWRWSWLALSIRYSLPCIIPIFLSLTFEKKPGSSPTNRIYSGTTKSCKSEHAIMAGYVQVHKTKGKETFIVGERMSGGLLQPEFSLCFSAEVGRESSPYRPSRVVLNEVSVYSCFFSLFTVVCSILAGFGK